MFNSFFPVHFSSGDTDLLASGGKAASTVLKNLGIHHFGTSHWSPEGLLQPLSQSWQPCCSAQLHAWAQQTLAGCVSSVPSLHQRIHSCRQSITRFLFFLSRVSATKAPVLATNSPLSFPKFSLFKITVVLFSPTSSWEWDAEQNERNQTALHSAALFYLSLLPFKQTNKSWGRRDFSQKVMCTSSGVAWSFPITLLTIRAAVGSRPSLIRQPFRWHRKQRLLSTHSSAAMVWSPWVPFRA